MLNAPSPGIAERYGLGGTGGAHFLIRDGDVSGGKGGRRRCIVCSVEADHFHHSRKLRQKEAIAMQSMPSPFVEYLRFHFDITRAITVNSLNL